MERIFTEKQIILLTYDGFLRGRARLRPNLEKCGLIGRITQIDSPVFCHLEGLELFQNPDGTERRVEPGELSRAELFYETQAPDYGRYILEIDASQIICNIETDERMMLHHARKQSQAYAQQLFETITKLKNKQ